MALSLYDITVPSYEQTLAASEGVLEKGLSFCQEQGIEPPELRVRNEKPETGKVSLVMSREGTEVVLTISDDGAGLDSDAIRRKAVANGLLDEGSFCGDLSREAVSSTTYRLY